MAEAVIKVDVPLDMELIKDFKASYINPSFNLRRKISEGLDRCKENIKDENVREILYHFYDYLSERCGIVQNILDCSNLDEVTGAVQDSLYKIKVKRYQIRIIADGNI